MLSEGFTGLGTGFRGVDGSSEPWSGGEPRSSRFRDSYGEEKPAICGAECFAGGFLGVESDSSSICAFDCSFGCGVSCLSTLDGVPV